MGVEWRETKSKALFHYEEAVIGGNVTAMFNLAMVEGRNGRTNRAKKFFMIAAKLGCDDSLEMLKKIYQKGDIDKDDFAAALRGHQAAVDATKSAQRNEAEVLVRNQN